MCQSFDCDFLCYPLFLITLIYKSTTKCLLWKDISVQNNNLSFPPISQNLKNHGFSNSSRPLFWQLLSLFLLHHFLGHCIEKRLGFQLPYHHHHQHHHRVHEGLGMFPVPWSSKWSWSLHLFLGSPMFLRLFDLYGLNSVTALNANMDFDFSKYITKISLSHPISQRLAVMWSDNTGLLIFTKIQFLDRQFKVGAIKICVFIQEWNTTVIATVSLQCDWNFVITFHICVFQFLLL